MKLEKEKISQKESEIFTDFLDECEKAYEDVFVGRFVNPFKKPWQDIESERQRQIAEKTEESTPRSERREIDPVELNRFNPD